MDERGRSSSVSTVGSVNSVMRQSIHKSGHATTLSGKAAQILAHRGAFLYLPLVFSNDLVAGSWWFVVGSALQVLIAIVMLVDVFVEVFTVPPDTGLKAFDDAGCWILLIISGVFFTFGSYIFVRAFEEPVPPPFFTSSRHLATDELAASWMYLFATAPAIPYSVVWLSYNPHRYQYWGAFFGSCAFVAGSGFFVYTCYPSNHDERAHGPPPQPHILKFIRCCCGANSWMSPHLKTDWLAACWFFFWSSLFWFIGSWLLMFSATNDRQIYAWVSSAADAFVYTVGSAYYVAGSYAPEEKSNVNFDDPANYPPQMEYYLERQGRKDLGSDVVYLDQDDTVNVLHDNQTMDGRPEPWHSGQDEYYPQQQQQQGQAPELSRTDGMPMQRQPNSHGPFEQKVPPSPVFVKAAGGIPSPPKDSPAHNPFRVAPHFPV